VVNQKAWFLAELGFAKLNGKTIVQQKLLNVISLGQRDTDNNKYESSTHINIESIVIWDLVNLITQSK
jgi:hypothetical protein